MDNNYESLPMRALEDVPVAKAGAKKIVGLKKQSGKVTGYKLSDGSMISKQDGVSLAKSGEIKGVGVATRNGNEYLKSIPDDTENNNLGNLPTVSD